MAENARLLGSLLDVQNSDGGWGYGRGVSWTEPTALALLALYAARHNGPAYRRGLNWLQSRQRPDGGWSVTDAVTESSSVTSTCLLALGCADGRSKAYISGLHWTIRQIHPDLTARERLKYWLQGMPLQETASGGTSWVPGTAAWIAPTVMMTLAFSQALRLGFTDSTISKQIAHARSYILSRRCPDGGWNHGGTRFRSSDAESYPEMTGLALLAFEPGDPELASSLHCGEAMTSAPGSSEAQSWLRMAMARHKQSVPDTSATLPWRTHRDLALHLLASADANPLFI